MTTKFDDFFDNNMHSGWCPHVVVMASLM